ncbi:MAG: Bug family tripartite tricarboxylate transporter substrate binding protein, partial [Burkholderiales bacterium]
MKANVLHLCCGLVAALGPAMAEAQTYPARPVRLIIPFSAGGAADVPGRILSNRLSEALGQQVVIDNRPGAGSTIGAEAAAKSPPDGYTLFMISNTHFVSAALHKKLNYDSLNDFTPITQITSAPNVLIVHPSMPAKNVKELVALAKARPGEINYASSGNGSTQHL